jgi:DNA-directed RNA polymerase specialized sigma24 family protein
MDGDAILMQRFREGDQQAAAALFQRYVGKLVSLAQRRLSAQLGRRIDAEDIVQSAFRSFFRGTRDGRFQIEPGQELWRLLAVMTVTKL